MIGFLSGNIHNISDTTATINVNGVGYEVFVPKTALLTLGKPGTSISLEVYTHVTENALQLFGFTSLHEKSVFQKLISVSGVGPKMALNMISEMPVNNILSAIIRSDTITLSGINGIGKKTAEKIIVELKDKFKDMPVMAHMAESNNATSQDARLSDVLSALLNLGYPEMQAKRIISRVVVTTDDTVETLIKKTLTTKNINAEF